MIDLNNLNVVNMEANTEHGFFFVEFESGKSLQCCLENKDGECIEQIKVGDSGYLDGLCADCNEWAATEDGEWSHIELFLVERARAIGVQIID